MLGYFGVFIGLGSTVYFLYSYNLSVRNHITENKEMHRLIKEIHENTKKQCCYH